MEGIKILSSLIFAIVIVFVLPTIIFYYIAGYLERTVPLFSKKKNGRTSVLLIVLGVFLLPLLIFAAMAIFIGSIGITV